MYPALIKSEIKLTIGMLVSNHVHIIRKCMESIKPLLDAVPSELVVLDTKGEETDGSIDIVREYTDKIYRFEWCNDFSAARNALLDHAKGEWFLYFDDDEFFDDVQEFIDFFQSGECENYYTGFYYTRDYDADGTYSMGIAGRMIRRTVNTQFVGKVHETFNETFAPNKQFNCFTHHYGYVYSAPEARLKHQERNVSILKEMLEEEGYTPKICAQLVQEYLSVEETSDKGLEFAIEALSKLQEEGQTEDSSFQWIAVATVRYYSRTEEYQKLLEQANEVLNTYALSNVATLALAATVVLAAIKEDDANVVLEYAPLYLQNYEWAKEHPEEALLQTQMDFPRFMEERYYNEILRVANISAEYKAEQERKQKTEIKRMKRFRKEDMLGVLATLKKANRLTATPGISAQQLTDILTKCQSSAITLGEKLERRGEAGEAIIHMLEEYCEALYLQSQNCGNDAVQKEIQAGIEALLGVVEKEIENLPADKKVAVFLPYKAAMWDSLESVWKAADEDPDCDAYVVPIPYFDRNPDTSLGEMHYEGDQYPDYVPVYSWEEFSIPDMKPDMVFIHNPYDEYNYVTSVHPAFYSSEIKKYVKKLVYIPYFVTGGTLSEMHSSLPVYYNADYIISQNDYQMKDVDNEIKKKVVPLGSPKFDRVINLNISEEMIPEKWKSKIRDKVLFLNTGINGVLTHGEQSLFKLQYIVKIAEEENVTVLWRPHPLLEATIQSMRPNLWETYKKTVEKITCCNNCIIDYTSDVDLAIRLSDAYVGEPTSSISHLFGVLGKPIFFIRQGILEERQLSKVKISCCAEHNGMIWAVMSSRNGLLKVSTTGVIEEVYYILGESDKSNLYSDIVIAMDKIYLIPRNAKEIAVFDLTTKQFSKIVLLHPQQEEKFNKAFFCDGKIYMVPRLYAEMVILSCKDGEVKYNKSLVEEIKKITNIPDIMVSANGTRLVGKCLFIAAPNKPYIFTYDCYSNEFVAHRIRGTENGFCCLEYIAGKFVLGSMSGCEIIVWEPKSHTAQQITRFPKGWNTEENICFWDIVEKQGDAYIFPRKNPMILKLSMKDLTLEAVEMEFPFSLENRQETYFNHPNHFLMVRKLGSGKIMVQDANRHGMAEFRTNGSFDWIPVELLETHEVRLLKQAYARQGHNLPWAVYETKQRSLRSLISYLRYGMHDEECQKKVFAKVANNIDGTAGNRIYEYAIKSLYEK